jgi:HSP20 family protein
VDLVRAMMNPDTLRDLENMSDRINRLLARRSRPVPGRDESGERDESMALVEWVPVVDVLETDNEFQIRAELPGVEKTDVKLSVEKGVLLISGHREQEKEEKGARYHKIERAYGTFARSFTMPDVVDEQKVAAEFKNGVLTVRLPKSEKARPKSIEVRIA